MPASSFLISTCKDANISLPPTLPAMKKFLDRHGTSHGSVHTKAVLLDRCAALAWLQHAIANNVPPTSWPSILDDASSAVVASLYPLPSNGSQPGAQSSPDFERLARIVSAYLPVDALAADSPSSHAAGARSTPLGINTVRPDLPAPVPPAALEPVTPAPPTAPVPPATPSLPRKRRLLMHDELRPLLEDAVYQALDVSSGLKPAERAKLQKAHREDHAGTLLDNTVGAAFSHQFILALPDGAHFHPVKRGLALAAAGRSASLSSAVPDFPELVARDTFLRQLRDQWSAISVALTRDLELSGTQLNRLWDGVSYIMRTRAARATTWGVPEITTACRTQYEALTTYRTSVASALARASAALPDVEAAKYVNRSYAEFFLPFWWEHILQRSPLDEDKAAAEVKAMFAAAPAVPITPALVPPALPAPPAAALPHTALLLPTPYGTHVPPAPATLAPPFPTAYPGLLAPPPPAAAIVPPGLPAPPVAYYPLPPQFPLPQPTRPTAATQPPQGRYDPPFVGKPVSALIIGQDLGVAVPPGRACLCPISVAFQGREHRPFECPLRYHRLMGQCPGWTPAGTRIPTCWNGENLTTACRAEWKTFLDRLQTARAASGALVSF